MNGVGGVGYSSAPRVDAGAENKHGACSLSLQVLELGRGEHGPTQQGL